MFYTEKYTVRHTYFDVFLDVVFDANTTVVLLVDGWLKSRMDVVISRPWVKFLSDILTTGTWVKCIGDRLCGYVVMQWKSMELEMKNIAVNNMNL